MKYQKEIEIFVEKFIDEYLIESSTKHNFIPWGIFPFSAYKVFFDLKKSIPTSERNIFFRELINYFIIYIKNERDVLSKKYEFEVIDADILSQKIKISSGICDLLKYQIASSIKYIQEIDIIEMLNISKEEKYISFYNETLNCLEPREIGQSLLYLGTTLDFAKMYVEYHGISENIKREVEEIRNSPIITKSNWLIERINDLVNWQEKTIKKEKDSRLNTKDLNQDKKWLLLQQHKLDFIEDRNDFYLLIEKLSTITYTDYFLVTDEIKNLINRIEPIAFEAFLLDIHKESCENVKTRSGWFVGDKVIFYQICVWLAYILETPNRNTILTAIVEKCFVKLPSVGPTSRKLGDFILLLFSESLSVEGLGILLKIKARNKYSVFVERLDYSIYNAVKYTNLNPDEVEDYFIDDFGLENDTLIEHFGTYRCELKISSYDDIEATWYNGESILKLEPSAVKKDFANELKIWKAKINSLKKELSGQRIRLENIYTKNKTWNFEDWKKYVFEHKLVRFLSSKLIWQFINDETTQIAFYQNGQFVDSQNTVIQLVDIKEITLWHPANATVAEVQSWRNFMLQHEIKQPFKQAFREIYIVTDAEIRTSTYSNRYADHVIRHFKFVAVAQQRLWKYDKSNVYSQQDCPIINYKDFDIRCQFDINGDYEYATTGRVHFRRISNNEALQMENIPTIIFSETMRDMDLFVATCSVGADEFANVGGHQTYWSSYAEGELSNIAQTRKEILTTLISKLKIKDQCEILEKQLLVKGKVRTYKIHFASGNIMMMPNDEYLCIIPDSSKKESNRIFLPFDDDATLSIIISKALLLADDDKIKDPVILNQINRK